MLLFTAVRRLPLGDTALKLIALPSLVAVFVRKVGTESGNNEWLPRVAIRLGLDGILRDVSFILPAIVLNGS